jgi:peptidoglycan hydrolase-like protein with peptidoglycan-binding domain
MRKFILASASVLALGIAGSGIGYAAEPASSSTNLPASSAQTQNTQTQTAPVKASESEIKQAQEQLKKASIYKGTADGKMGPEMKQAVSEFQQKHELKQTGMLDQETLAALNNNQNGAASNLSGSTTRPSTSSGTIAPTKSQ